MFLECINFMLNVIFIAEDNLSYKTKAVLNFSNVFWIRIFITNIKEFAKRLLALKSWTKYFSFSCISKMDNISLKKISKYLCLIHINEIRSSTIHLRNKKAAKKNIHFKHYIFYNTVKTIKYKKLVSQNTKTNSENCIFIHNLELKN